MHWSLGMCVAHEQPRFYANLIKTQNEAKICLWVWVLYQISSTFLQCNKILDEIKLPAKGKQKKCVVLPDRLSTNNSQHGKNYPVKLPEEACFSDRRETTALCSDTGGDVKIRLGAGVRLMIQYGWKSAHSLFDYFLFSCEGGGHLIWHSEVLPLIFSCFLSHLKVKQMNQKHVGVLTIFGSTEGEPKLKPEEIPQDLFLKVERHRSLRYHHQNKLLSLSSQMCFQMFS